MKKSDTLLLTEAQGNLSLHGNLTDVVQENRPAVSRFKASHTPLQCPGEGTFLTPKQLGGDQRRRNGRTIHPDECSSRPARPSMNGASDQLLAGSGFSRDQDRRLRRCNLRDLRQHPCSASEDPTISSNIEERSI